MSRTNDIKRVRRRRLSLLAIAVVVIGAAIAGLWLYRKHERRLNSDAARQAGIAAYKAKDYVKALDRLAYYLNHGKPQHDAEAWYDFAQARLKVPEPNHHQQGQAISALQHMARQDVAYKDGAELLAEFYLQSGQNNAALTLTNRALAKEPKNKKLLADKAMALAGLSRTHEALRATRVALKANPNDLGMWMLSFQLRSQNGTSGQTLVDDAKKLVKQHQGDARYALLAAYAWNRAGNNTQVLAWLKQAAKQVKAQATTVRKVVIFLNQAQMYPTSLSVLERTADKTGDRQLMQALTRRLFDRGEDKQVVARLAKLKVSAANTNMQLAGIKAISLYRLGRKEAANKIIKALKRRSNASAKAWARVITAMEQSGPGAAATLAKACRAGLQTLPNDAYFHAYLGDALASMGENELAVDQWSDAAQARPSWALPHLKAAQALLAMGGHEQEALKQAAAGFHRRPHSVNAAVMYLQARIANLPKGSSRLPTNLQHLMAEVEKTSPHNTALLHAKVRLLARHGEKSAAAAAVRSALQWKPALSQSAMLALASLSKQLGLGTSQACYAAVATHYGLTPDVALARAIRLARRGKVAAGRALLEKGRKAAGKQTAGPWQMAWAQYLDAVGDGHAKQVWLSLARKYADDARIQEAALDSDALRGDRTAQAKLIDRLKAIEGPQSVAWKVARARWLLGGKKKRSKIAEAISLLQQAINQAGSRIEPHLLLAEAHQKLGQLPLAVTSLKAAAQLRPDAVAIRLQLGRDQQRLGHFDDAKQTLVAAAAKPGATAKQQQQAGALLAAQGAISPAIEILQRARKMAGAHETELTMLLASMYQQKGDTNKAKALCRTLVARPTGQGLLFASEFYASHGQRKAAKQAIGKLSQLRLPAGHAAMLRGQYLAATGQVKQAVATLRQAVAKAPADARIWRTAIRFELTANLAKQAVQTAQQALTKLGGRRGHEGIAAIVDHAPAVRVFANTQFQPLVLALLEDEQNRTTAGQVLDLLRAAKQTNTAKHLATQLTKIADGHIDFLALQDAAAAVDMGVGQTSDAARLATRAMARFPAAAKPAQLAAEARATLQQWNRGLVAAQTWRDRMSGSKEPADQLIGQAQEQLGLPNAAVRTLGRYIDKAMKTPTKHYDLIRLYAQALVDAGQVNRAEKLLQPMLIDSTSRWRLLWLNLATYGIQDPATAASWLEQLEPTIPTGATPERIALARAWWSLAARAQKSAYQKRARTIIDQVVQSNQTSQQAWFLRGLMAEAVDKLDVAKRSYEHAIKLDGKLAAAKNNLAMVLLHQHGDLERAIKLAKDAVQAAPKNANFLDTLAQVEAAHQAYAAAIRTIEKAIKLQPHNQQWQNRLAAIKRAQPDTAMK